MRVLVGMGGVPIVCLGPLLQYRGIEPKHGAGMNGARALGGKRGKPLDPPGHPTKVRQIEPIHGDGKVRVKDPVGLGENP